MTFDAVVVGAGPAGCAAATVLARAGRSVLLVDRDAAPRFKVGESLLPWNLPIFEELGVAEKVAAAGFMPKHGAVFWNEETGGVRHVVFRNAFDDRHPSAYHVKRAAFDALLQEHAAASGASLVRGRRAEEVVFEGSRAVGVRLVDEATGAAETARARAVVDATGQVALLATKLGLRRADPKLRRAALYAHFDGVRRGDGARAGDILLPFGSGVWYWAIPFSDGSASVGAVFDPALRTPGVSNEALFAELLARSPKMRELLSDARRTTGVSGVADYSVAARRVAGDGWVLAGDAAAFLDPVFSSGVFLAMAEGLKAGRAIDAALAKGRAPRASDFRGYERAVARMVGRFRPFVHGFYDADFARMFCEEAPIDALRAAVTSILAGDVDRPSWGVRFWYRMTLFFFAVHKRLGAPAPSAPPAAA